mmetsp:Transcript_61138/g.145632  ORF Transcript_61138/g.145632 Transcript_61138/m.145632 type:complete len:223 (-) Transcript_61138:117-785(-)
MLAGGAGTLRIVHQTGADGGCRGRLQDGARIGQSTVLHPQQHRSIAPLALDPQRVLMHCIHRLQPVQHLLLIGERIAAQMYFPNLPAISLGESGQAAEADIGKTIVLQEEDQGWCLTQCPQSSRSEMLLLQLRHSLAFDSQPAIKKMSNTGIADAILRQIEDSLLDSPSCADELRNHWLQGVLNPVKHATRIHACTLQSCKEMASCSVQHQSPSSIVGRHFC